MKNIKYCFEIGSLPGTLLLECHIQWWPNMVQYVLMTYSAYENN